MMTDFPEGNALVYCEAAFHTTNGKTAHGLVRRTQRYRVLSVIDSLHSGEDAGDVLDGKPAGIPICADLEHALKMAKEACAEVTHFVVGLAPDGGRLSPRGRDDVKKAIQLGLNVDCGLHDFLSEDEEIADLAKEHGVNIRDVRKPPPREELHFFCGKIEEVDSLKVAVLGTDSAIGKRTTAWALADACETAGLTVEVVGTGQTAWMQGVRYGLILDSLVVDFVTGEIEHAVWLAWKERKPDVIIIEGQGSLLNPAYPGGLEILSAGRPEAVVLQHAPARKEYDGFPGYTLHPLGTQIRAIEAVSKTRVASVTVNHEGLDSASIHDASRRISVETGLPAVDVLAHSAAELLPHLTKFHRRVHRKYLGSLEKNFAAPKNTIEHLIAVDALEIGPIRIFNDRFKAPYSVVKNGTFDTFELIYRFEEPVFDPDDEGSKNLAHLMAAQVAMNYALFCRRIVFHGLFDDHDTSFIREMTENTAREIYVKKLLEHNPFIVKGFPPTSVIKKQRYTAAELEFPDKTSCARIARWNTRSDRIGVLLSGGKESLLSYGILDEIGHETHPLFVNESGRHWYTALNSYRFFREHVPRTARVWTNSDRLFSWMLGHLPFVRHDFFELRADDYPIRLWTVAVFLFGVLPLLKKRGIGAVIIGDEYDTTKTSNFKSIPHYDGLFDQSIHFDRALTSYFQKKGWNLVVFSILRPLSEFLVLRTLSQRYPHLQENQLSCHMAHIERGRAVPCGKCEKCHRIVSMLVALGHDPVRFGYTESQVRNCLGRLARTHLHQESGVSEHVRYLLAERHRIESQQTLRSHPEIEHLRFDDEGSPIDAIPKEIRKNVIEIQMKHASGACKKTDGSWVSFDPIPDA
jgi:uncharacterized NAD-dependent epimerase/dehydratase family protein